MDPAKIADPFEASADTGPGGPRGTHWAWTIG
jgi:hypothetical protein